MEITQTKTTAEFLSCLNALNIKLWVDSDRLRCDAPKDALTPSLLSELQQRKLEIIQFLHQAKFSDNSSLETIRPIPRSQDIPLSFAQQRLWFVEQMQEVGATYNEFFALKIQGYLNVSIMEEVVTEIIRRHEVLRTNFVIKDTFPVQVIAPHTEISIPVVDLQLLSKDEQLIQVQKLIRQEQTQTFNLCDDFLVRITLLKLAEDSYVLLLNMHHIVSDGWSVGIFVREFTALYQAFAQGKSSPLPELSVQYADFACWQRELLNGDTFKTQLEYWQKQLAGAPPLLELPTDRVRSPKQTFSGSSVRMHLDSHLTHQLKLLSQQSGATLYMTLLGAFLILLSRYSNQEDIVVGSPIANRNRSEIESLIGFFINNLALRVNLEGNPTFTELLQRVRKVTLDAYAHQDLPFEQLVEKLQPERSLSYSPLFQIVFALQNTPLEELELPGLTLTPMEVERIVSKNDLILLVEEHNSELIALWDYNTDLFDAQTITRMAEHFQTLLTAIVANPQQTVGELPLLTATERHQLLVEWNNTQFDYPQDKCIHELFTAQVEKTPDAIAVVFQDQHLTYQQLNHHANQLANYLQSLGIGAEVPVGICVERSLEMAIGLLGILKAGAAYIPLSPNYPFERLSFILEDVQPPVILTQEHLLDKLPSSWSQVICLDSEWEDIAGFGEENPANKATPENLAYVIYTSGSTGKPKGVLVPHQGLCNLVQAQIQRFDVNPDSRVLQFAAFSFDASVSEVFMALCSGASLYLDTSEKLLPSSSLIELIQDKQITHITLPPSALAVLPTADLPIKSLIVAGEACGSDLVAQWSSNRRFFNAYGPSECTVCATIAECTDSSKKPPIGRPISNTQVYILDKHLQPVPIGVTGEIYIGGVGVARGYLNRPDLTAQKFIANPFISDELARLYKTGDFGRYLADGNIQFLGRIDHQVKIRGFRIEPDEIQAVLLQHPDIEDVVVVAREDNSLQQRLVAYVVEQQQNSPQAYKNYLRELLPDYMIPSEFVLLESLPLSPNGKVDRHALPAPEQTRLKSESNFVLPRDTLELQLAEIWEEVLEVRPMGIKDNFFDNGGHSLLAIRLMSKIEKAFGKNLPLTTLFSCPTVEQLASILRLDDSSSRSPLVAIQPHGDKTPLFYMPGGGGNVIYLYHLARHLGFDQPFYGLQARGLDGDEPPHTQIEEIAAYNIQAIKTIQPQGPYLLGGHSFGSFVAFEMALQLQHQGEKVALLALMDTPAPTPDLKLGNSDVDDATYLVGLASNIERFSGYKLSISYEDLETLSTEEQLNYVLERLKIVNILPAEAKLKQLRGLLQVFKANDQTQYLPQSIYADPITLFRALDSHDFGANLQGWEKLSTATVETFSVPGDHISMMTEPHVQVLAEKLKACLEGVRVNVA
jgi:amino acid adenylation domain-containing protein